MDTYHNPSGSLSRHSQMQKKPAPHGFFSCPGLIFFFGFFSYIVGHFSTIPPGPDFHPAQYGIYLSDRQPYCCVCQKLSLVGLIFFLVQYKEKSLLCHKTNKKKLWLSCAKLISSWGQLSKLFQTLPNLFSLSKLAFPS